MGDVNRILVTGGAGYLGRAIVSEARKNGIAVTAIVRSKYPLSWKNDDGIRIVNADLAEFDVQETLAAAASDADVIVHAAGHMGNEKAPHDRDTLRATDHLLKALKNAPARRFVLVSSMSVYDYLTVKPGGTVTEATKVEAPDKARDVYTASKLRQEHLCQVFCEQDGRGLWMLRIGLVYSKDQLSTAHTGQQFGPVMVQVGKKGEVPVVHVHMAAKAIIAAVLTDPDGTKALNILDDDRPSRLRVIDAIGDKGGPRFAVQVSFPTALVLAKLARPFARYVPGLLKERILRARMMELNYPNDAMHKALNVSSDATFEELMQIPAEDAA